MNNKKQTVILTLCAILPALGTIITGIGSITKNESVLWKWTFLVLAILSAFASVISIIINNRLNSKTEKELNERKELFSQYENYIGDGKKMLENEAFISVDEQNKAYIISIRKKYRILDKAKNF